MTSLYAAVLVLFLGDCWGFGKRVWRKSRDILATIRGACFRKVYCPLCDHAWVKDDRFPLIDYVCPCGQYEWHFDWGLWDVRVGEEWWSFWDFDEDAEHADLCRREIRAALDVRGCRPRRFRHTHFHGVA